MSQRGRFIILPSLREQLAADLRKDRHDEYITLHRLAANYFHRPLTDIDLTNVSDVIDELGYLTIADPEQALPRFAEFAHAALLAGWAEAASRAARVMRIVESEPSRDANLFPVARLVIALAALLAGAGNKRRLAAALSRIVTYIPQSQNRDESALVALAQQALDRDWGAVQGGDERPKPVPAREFHQRLTGRNSKWRNFNAFDIVSMPDKWEYPWFAAWDLAFHCVTLAHLDPAFAKYQLIMACREWFQHPNGALPAHEWDFGDVSPPVHAWAALEVFAIDGARDFDFLSRVFDKLLVNFTWWVNREDASDRNVFEGGFLGLDNIGPIDRSHLAAGYTLEQSDATGWMGSYALALGTIAAVLNWSGQRQAQDLVLKFLEHFAGIRTALDEQGLWDETDGLFYDRLVTPSGYSVPVKVHSMVGIIPVLAAGVLDGDMLHNALTMNKQFTRFLQHEVGDVQKLAETPQLRGQGASQRLLLSVARPAQLERLFAKLFDESEFLSPHGLRAVSAYHRDHPYQFDAEGYQSSIDYEPAESTTSMFGGNSNWRGPIWMPVNYLVVESLERYYRFYGGDFEIEYPTGSGKRLTLDLIIADLQDRLISLFTRDATGRRACFGGTEKMQTDPAWKDNLIFSEYFHGDNGAAIGAFHQTGWTGLIADLILRRHGAVPALGDVLRDPQQRAQQ